MSATAAELATLQEQVTAASSLAEHVQQLRDELSAQTSARYGSSSSVVSFSPHLLSFVQYRATLEKQCEEMRVKLQAAVTETHRTKQEEADTLHQATAELESTMKELLDLRKRHSADVKENQQLRDQVEQLKRLNALMVQRQKEAQAQTQAATTETATPAAPAAAVAQPTETALTTEEATAPTATGAAAGGAKKGRRRAQQ